ncbi:MAG: hypothetical protein ACFCVE_10220 [Phycisphaerae bacterium]
MIEHLEHRRLLATDLFNFTFGDRFHNDASKVAVDPAGNTIVAGVFSGTTDFQPGTSATTLTARGDTDGFVAKYSVRGKLIWAVRFGGDYTNRFISGSLERAYTVNPRLTNAYAFPFSNTPITLGEVVRALEVGPDGSVYVGGAFRQEADFGADVRSGGPDVDYYNGFVTRISPDGEFLWTAVIDGPFDDVVNDIAVDAAGNVFAGGYFTRFADFNPNPTRQFIVNAEGRGDAFLALYSARGRLGYVNTFGGDTVASEVKESVNGVAVDSQGRPYITGTYVEGADFDPGPGFAFLPEIGATDTFLAAYERDGSLRYAKGFGGEFLDGGLKIETGPDDSLYVASYFSGIADADPGPATLNFVSQVNRNERDANTDILLSRFTPGGDLIWARQITGTDYETVDAMVVDEQGSVMVTGGWFGIIDLDPGPGRIERSSTFSPFTLDDLALDDGERPESYDAYFLYLSQNGKYIYSTTFGGAGDDFGSGLAIRPDGRIFLTGRLTQPSIGFPTLGPTNLIGVRSELAFVLRLERDGIL